MPWEPGAAVVRREIWRGRPWLGTVVLVVEDRPDLLVTYLPPGAAFAFPDGPWPGGRHPWHGRGGWEGHGVLALHRPHEAYAVVHFWEGPERRFAGWYLNLQEPVRRTTAGFDTYDLELDVWWPAGGRPRRKDWDLLEARVREGRFTEAEAETIRAEGERLVAELEEGRPWWDGAWAAWQPDPSWRPRPLPAGWEEARPREPAPTPRLVLRAAPEAGAETLAGLYAALGERPEEAAREAAEALAHWERHGFGHLVAVLRETGEAAGVVELHHAGPGLDGIDPAEVELGWALLPAHRGRGLAVEAAGAAAAHALAELGHGHLVAYVRPENAASARVAERVGFRRRGRGRSRSGAAVAIWELRR